MRIISWNMQGQYIAPEKLVAALNQVRADALIIQEPTESLTVAITTRNGANTRHKPTPPEGPKWNISHFTGQGAQKDRYAIAYRDGVILKLTQQHEDPISEQNSDARKYLIAQIEKDGKEGVVIATCHAPYKEKDSAQAVLYMNALFENLTGQVDALQSSVRIFMGDTNLYGTGAGSEVNPKGWTCKLQSPTGKGTEGGALDRIYVRGSTADAKHYKCGRICVKSAPNPSRVDKDTIKDYIIPEGSSPFDEVWGKSDHWAIYFDSTEEESPPLSKDEKSTSTSTEKRPRDDSDAGLVELDDGEKTVKQRQKK